MAGPGRKPDWKVMAMERDNQDVRGQVGAGWNNDDGSIGVKIAPFVVLDRNASIRLYPNTPRPGSRSTGSDGPSDDDIPF